MATYSNAAIFASEAISTCFAIYLGESIIANEVLANTKGRSMGWGFVALGFGFSFGLGVMILGYISAHMNPAVCLALLILGKTNGAEFGCAIAGEFLGALIGAVLVWLHFLPHFKTVPTPPTTGPTEMLLRGGDPLSATALGIGSYNVKEEDVEARKRGLGNITHAFEDIKYYLKQNYYEPEHPSAHAALVQIALGPYEARTAPPDEENGGGSSSGKSGALNRLRRRSVQVCDVHRRLKDMDIEEFRAMLLSPSSVHHQVGGAARKQMHPSNSTGDLPATESGEVMNNNSTEETKKEKDKKPQHPAEVKRQERLDQLYDAAVIADQNCKLSIFATRPAIYSPVFNFLCEFLCTTALVLGALLIYARRDLLQPPEYALFRSQEGIWIGFFVFVAILGLGGPTGIAANPARDFSPRLAHFLLPINGKGNSEFYYSWIPFFAPFVGGCAAAGLYAAIELLNNSKVH